MGLILGVRVVQTIGFHKMEISPLDAADYECDNRLNLVPFCISREVYRGKHGRCTI